MQYDYQRRVFARSQSPFSAATPRQLFCEHAKSFLGLQPPL